MSRGAAEVQCSHEDFPFCGCGALVREDDGQAAAAGAEPRVVYDEEDRAGCLCDDLPRDDCPVLAHRLEAGGQLSFPDPPLELATATRRWSLEQWQRERPGAGPVAAPKLVHTYFAYGSNLDATQMRHRCPDSRRGKRALLEGFSLTFTGRGARWSGGVATVVPEEGGVVYGLLYRLSEADLRSLDGYEGVPSSYVRRKVRVVRDDGRVLRVWTYLKCQPGTAEPAAAPTFDPPGAPYLAKIHNAYGALGFDYERLRVATRGFLTVPALPPRPAKAARSPSSTGSAYSHYGRRPPTTYRTAVVDGKVRLRPDAPGTRVSVRDAEALGVRAVSRDTVARTVQCDMTTPTGRPPQKG